jgi:hypothetical protein
MIHPPQKSNKPNFLVYITVVEFVKDQSRIVLSTHTFFLTPEPGCATVASAFEGYG